jgi:hypothetical protein
VGFQRRQIRSGSGGGDGWNIGDHLRGLFFEETKERQLFVKTLLKIGVVAALVLLMPARIFACAACYGGTVDSPLTDGMNWGIFTLLGVVITVLASILVFFVHIIRKGEAMAAKLEKSASPIEA